MIVLCTRSTLAFQLKHARAKHDRDLSQMRNQLDNECASRFAAEKKLQELRQHVR